MLELNGLCAPIGAGKNLRDISIDVARGRVAVVIGPNGAGKTSLLRAICGDLPLSAGQVTLNRRSMEDWSLECRATCLAILPQRSTLDFPFTVEEVVLMGRNPHSTGLQRDRKIAHDALCLLDSQELAQQVYVNLSGGEKQRVQLARVAAQIWEPTASGDRLLILDEPSSSLDLSHQQTIVNMLNFFTLQGVSILMVLHDLNLAARCADELVILDEGRLVQRGSLDQVLSKQNLDSYFHIQACITTNPLNGKPMVVT